MDGRCIEIIVAGRVRFESDQKNNNIIQPNLILSDPLSPLIIT
jgi:hypothetical protein